jgi:hypothetical protein
VEWFDDDFFKGVRIGVIVVLIGAIVGLIIISLFSTIDKITIVEIKTPSGQIISEKIIEYETFKNGSVKVKVDINGKIITYRTSWENVIIKQEKMN